MAAQVIWANDARIRRDFRGWKGAGLGAVIGGAGGLGTTAFRGRQKITLSSGQELLIRVTGR